MRMPRLSFGLRSMTIVLLERNGVRERDGRELEPPAHAWAVSACWLRARRRPNYSHVGLPFPQYRSLTTRCSSVLLSDVSDLHQLRRGVLALAVPVRHNQAGGLAAAQP